LREASFPGLGSEPTQDLLEGIVVDLDVVTPVDIEIAPSIAVLQALLAVDVAFCSLAPAVLRGSTALWVHS